jgi:hypothetical protein
MWSAFVLPFLEDEALKDLMTIGEGGLAGGNFQWAHPGPYRYPITDRSFRNIIAVETLIPTYRCPSAGLPERQYDVSSDNWHVMQRVPGSYLGCASGRYTDQNSPRGFLDGDGVLVGHDHQEPGKPIFLKKITDGLSKTVLVGEALHDVQDQIEIGQQRELATGDHKDHWYIGSDDIDIYNDVSECLGSTGVGINLHRLVGSIQDAQNVQIQALQVCFSSAHPGITQVAMCDGSVHRIEEDVDPRIWRGMGTRAGQDSAVSP